MRNQNSGPLSRVKGPFREAGLNTPQEGGIDYGSSGSFDPDGQIEEEEEASPFEGIITKRSSIITRWRNESDRNEQSRILSSYGKDARPESAKPHKVPKIYFSKYLHSGGHGSNRDSKLANISSAPEGAPAREARGAADRTKEGIRKGVLLDPDAVSDGFKYLKKAISGPVIESDPAATSGRPRENEAPLHKSKSEGTDKYPIVPSASAQAEGGKHARATEVAPSEEDDKPISQLGILSRMNNAPSVKGSDSGDLNSPAKKFVIPDEVRQYEIEYGSPGSPRNTQTNGDADTQASLDVRTAIGSISPPLSNPQRDHDSLLIKAPPVHAGHNGAAPEAHAHEDGDIEHLVDNMMHAARKNIMINEDAAANPEYYFPRNTKKPARSNKGLAGLMRHASFTTSAVRSEIRRVFDSAISQVYNGETNKDAHSKTPTANGRSHTAVNAIPSGASTHTFSKWLPKNDASRPQMQGVVIERDDHRAHKASPGGPSDGTPKSASGGGKFIDRLCRPDERVHFYCFVTGLFFVPAAFAGALIRGKNVWRKRCIITSAVAITIIAAAVLVVLLINSITEQ